MFLFLLKKNITFVKVLHTKAAPSGPLPAHRNTDRQEGQQKRLTNQ